MRPDLCTVCGRGVTLPHQEWCERVRWQNAESCPPGRVECKQRICMTHMTHVPHLRTRNGSTWGIPLLEAS